MSEDITNDPAYLRRHLEGLRAAALRAVTDHPGAIVLYDPIALADAIDAILTNGTTDATDPAAKARADYAAAQIRSGSFRFVQVSPTIKRP